MCVAAVFGTPPPLLLQALSAAKEQLLAGQQRYETDVGQLHGELQAARTAARRSDDDVTRLVQELDTMRRELDSAVGAPCAYLWWW